MSCFAADKYDVYISAENKSRVRGITLGYNDKYNLDISGVDESAFSGKEKCWGSTNQSIVDVDNEGRIKTRRIKGTSTIVLKSADDLETILDSITVKVTNAESALAYSSDEGPDSDGFDLTADIDAPQGPDKMMPSFTLYVGDTFYLTTSKSLDDNGFWKSSSPQVASVSNGKITALKDGTTTITAYKNDMTGAPFASLVVTVKPKPVESVELKVPVTLCLNIGDTAVIPVNVTPTEFTEEIVWSSNNEKVAAVSDDGVITAVGGGVATITATVGPKTASCFVQVMSTSNTSATRFHGFFGNTSGNAVAN